MKADCLITEIYIDFLYWKWNDKIERRNSVTICPFRLGKISFSFSKYNFNQWLSISILTYICSSLNVFIQFFIPISVLILCTIYQVRFKSQLMQKYKQSRKRLFALWVLWVELINLNGTDCLPGSDLKKGNKIITIEELWPENREILYRLSWIRFSGFILA